MSTPYYSWGGMVGVGVGVGSGVGVGRPISSHGKRANGSLSFMDGVGVGVGIGS